MKKIAIFLLLGLLLTTSVFSQTANDVTITVEITNVEINGGKVYLAIFSNAESFRRENPGIAFELEADSTTLTKEVSLRAGDYVVSAFQDANGNQKLDSNLLGVPRELVGISNYFGTGLPTRNFDRQKITINNTTGIVSIGLYRF